MTLSPEEEEAVLRAGLAADQAARGRAVATVLSKQGKEFARARRLLADGYLKATAPSFHLIPRGEAMLSSRAFDAAYASLAADTSGFRDISVDSLHRALSASPTALAPLRMIAGLTYNELSVAIELATGARVTGAALRAYEREGQQRPHALRLIAEAIIAVIGRRVLEVPLAAQELFHSKLDKRDTFDGWESVQRSAAEGVPYSELLHQRYVGGVWRQVQDAYSEVKGDALLELPLAELLTEERVPHWRSPRGATGARLTAEKYGISPGPDFLVPDESPAVIIETKVGEDGGTVRDKAARIQRLGNVATQRGLVLCAAVDGKGWRERPSALADVVIATGGRTFSLATLQNILEVPELRAWRGKASSS